jgi:hypothetical protein
LLVIGQILLAGAKMGDRMADVKSGSFSQLRVTRLPRINHRVIETWGSITKKLRV